MISNIAKLVEGKFFNILVQDKGFHRKITRPEELVSFTQNIEKREAARKKTVQYLSTNKQSPKKPKIKNKPSRKNPYLSVKRAKHRGVSMFNFTELNKLKNQRTKGNILQNYKNGTSPPLNPTESIKRLQKQVLLYTKIQNR